MRSGCNQPPLAPADGNKNANPTAHSNAMINPFCFTVSHSLERPRWRGRPVGASPFDSPTVTAVLFCSWISSSIRDGQLSHCPISVEPGRDRSFSLFVEFLTLLRPDAIARSGSRKPFLLIMAFPLQVRKLGGG